MYPFRRQLWNLAALLVVCGAVSGACDDSSGNSQPKASDFEREGEPDFDWRSAFDRQPAAARAALGEPVGCSPERRLSALDPSDLGYFEEDVRKCHFPKAKSASDGRYYVDAIVYSREIPTAVILRRTEEMELGREVLEKFHIPELSIVQYRTTSWGGKSRPVLSYRMETIHGKIDRGSPIAVDLVGKPDAPDKLAFVRLGAVSKWPYSIDHVEIPNPSAAGPLSMLPRVTEGARLQKGIVLGMELELFSVRRQRFYPLHVSADDPKFKPVEFSREVFVSETPEGREPWDKQAETFVRRWIRHRRELGEVPTPVPVELHFTQTAPYHLAAQVVEGVQERLSVEFRIAGRRVSSFDAPFQKYVSVRTVPSRFRTSKQAKVMRDLDTSPLTIRATAEGFDVRANNNSIAARGDCPSDGPTYCLTDELDVAESLDRARSLQKQGDLPDSDRRVEKLLAAYDWRRLYNHVSDFVADVPEIETVFLRPENEMPTALAVRLLQLVRRRVTVPEADGCLESLPEEVSYGETTPCAPGGDVPVDLFEKPTFLRPD